MAPSPKPQAAEARAHPAVIIDRASLDARNYFLDTAADEATQAGQPERRAAHRRPDRAHHPGAQGAGSGAAGGRCAPSPNPARRPALSEAAVVVMKPDGAVSAMIGGVDYQDSVFNRATQAHRQPGSAFKPFVYLAALEAGISPWETRDDEAVDIGGYQPTNFGGKILRHPDPGRRAGPSRQHHHRQSGAGSRRRAMWWPPPSALGITSPLEANASLALGTSEVTPLELTAAYAAFANGGYRVSPYLVTRSRYRRQAVSISRQRAAAAAGDRRRM